VRDTRESLLDLGEQFMGSQDLPGHDVDRDSGVGWGRAYISFSAAESFFRLIPPGTNTLVNRSRRLEHSVATSHLNR
jgi:hypothetical protein